MWNSPSKLRREKFRSALKSNPEVFNQEFVETISDNLLKSEKTYWILVLGQSVLLTFLLASIYNINFTIKIFDAVIGTNLPLREILLLASSIVGLVTFTLIRETNYESVMIEVYLSEKLPADTYPYIRHKFRRLLGNMPLGAMDFATNTVPGFMQIFLIAITAIGLVAGIVCLLLIFLAIHLILLWQIWHQPELPRILNRLVIITVLSFDAFGAAFVILDSIPLPTRDFTPLKKLRDQLRKDSSTQPQKAAPAFQDRVIKQISLTRQIVFSLILGATMALGHFI